MSHSVAISEAISKPSIYKRMFAGLLSKIVYGSLTVQDQHETNVYGDPTHSLKANIIVNDQQFYKELFWGGGISLAESYICDAWDSKDLTLLLRVLTCNLDVVDKVDTSLRGLLFRWLSNGLHFLNKNNITGSRRNISKHYDLGNDFFSLFLDPTMMYSSAIYAQSTDTLEQASVNKLRTICDKLELSSTDHLLEIGTGWGGLAIYVVQNYNCRVTTTTISQEQFDYTVAKIKQLGLADKITVLKQDYRDLKGTYDKLVSIEMIEAVGHHYFATYFAQCSKLVKAEGLFLLQAITIADQRYASARDSVDFIKKHIFPGCCIPATTEILRQTQQHTDYNLLNVQDITLDYARTLKAWRDAFDANIANIVAQGFDQDFIRKWRYYFSYCEAGFLERAIFDLQLLFSKPKYRSQEYVKY